MLALAVVVLEGVAQGAGFGIYEWGGRGNAMGGAVVASPKDASTAAFNPAAATDLEGVHLYGGLSAINPKAILDMEGYNDANGKSNVWLIPHAYATAQINDRLWLTGAVFSRYGLGTEFDEEWAGRYNCTEATIESVSFSPNLVYKINDQWSVAAGPEFMYFKFLQRKTVDGNFVTRNDPSTYNYDIDAKLEGDSMGTGLNLSVYYKPRDWLTAGVVYRSQIKQHIKGNVWFRRQGTLAPMIAGAYSKDQEAKGVIILPDNVTVGLAVKPLDKLTVEGDVVWTRWSTYQELRIDYEERLVPGVAGSDHSTTVKNWKDTFRYQLGAEYELLDWMDVRVSYIYDQSPIRDDHDDYMIPAADRQLYSVGLGFHWDSYVIDLGYTYLQSESRDYKAGDATGLVTGKAHDLETHIVGLSLGYSF
ncbi:OmpP1/FadL family transporter [Desulfocurvus sp. DL9XJH121]